MVVFISFHVFSLFVLWQVGCQRGEYFNNCVPSITSVICIWRNSGSAMTVDLYVFNYSECCKPSLNIRWSGAGWLIIQHCATVIFLHTGCRRIVSPSCALSVWTLLAQTFGVCSLYTFNLAVGLVKLQYTVDNCAFVLFVAASEDSKRVCKSVEFRRQ